MIKLKFFCIAFLFFFSNSSFSQVKHTFSLGKEDFLLDGKPFQLICGELHPARIPKEYWRQRIQMTKAMGCNSIAVYIFWNYHEVKEGVFDFTSERRDIKEFVNLCQQEKMWVLIRPGPYVCAEWDFGGLPTYLLKIPDLKVRCMDKRYMAAATRYINRLAKEIKPMQVTNGGPVLMVQVENEYGSYGNDKTYLEELRKLWIKNGINVPFYTADGATPYMLEAGNIDGAAIGLDSGGSDADFEQAKKRNPNVPSFSSETYPGWLTHWGEPWARPDTGELKKEVEYLLKNKKSFNLYMAHGGTNFGFTAGANAFSPTEYQPDITSYDYDSPISEQGLPMPKYFMLRRLIQQYVSYKIPDIPKAIPSIEIPAFSLTSFTTIWKELPKAVASPQPIPMEMLNQNQGLVLYRTKLIGHKSGKLTITEPHDYAMVFLNGKFIDTIYRDGGKWTIELPKTDVEYPVLDILVEGMGHINFAQYMIDRKGITDRVTLNGMTLMDWQIFPLPLDEKFISSLKDKYPEGFHDGVFFKGEFNLTETGDTYFDMSNYTKGVLYVNGHNLGRFWNKGPQQRLYCPAGFLKRGKNQVIVFDFHLQQPLPVKAEKNLQ
ncbi:MAG: beta-galactosidase [Bacteroidetes bacterium]|nr:beta-galactosidase [Bacteroidota bacterium]